MQSAKPTFLYVGVPKAGSTWLAALLSHHPSIYVPRVKEISYFGKHYDRGLEWYFSHFRAGESYQHRGELTAGYLTDAHAVSRIAKDLPDISLIISLRKPFDRDYSAFQHYIRLIDANQSIKDFFLNANSNVPGWFRSASHYHDLIKKIESYGFRNVRYLLFDDIVSCTSNVCDSLSDFLNVDRTSWPHEILPQNVATVARSPSFVRLLKTTAALVKPLGTGELYARLRDSAAAKRLLFKKLGTADRKPSLRLSAAEYDMLSAAYEPHIRAAERSTGRTLSKWRERPPFVEIV